MSQLPNSLPKELSEEEKELQQALLPFNKFPKLKKWTELFLDKNNKKTYFNRTESAMQAYNCKDRIVASTIGSQNYRKLKSVASVFADDMADFSIERLFQVLFARSLTSENPEWWKMASEMLEIRDPKAGITITNNMQNNTQINVTDAQKVDFNAEFRKFVENS